MNDRWMPGRPVPALPIYPEHVVWRVVKDTRWAEARIRQVPHGQELRFVVGGAGRDDTLLQSTVHTDSAEPASMSVGTLQNFQGHGWRVDATTAEQSGTETQ